LTRKNYATTPTIRRVSRLARVCCEASSGGAAMTKQRPELGQRVTIRATFDKKYDDETGPREWRCVELGTPVEGVYIGYRFVYQGKWEYEALYTEFDEWINGALIPAGSPYTTVPVFKRTETVEAWLVVTDERTNPIRVLPEDVSYD
jgi:hypothetical protein